MTYKEIEHLIETDSNGKYIRLIIPANEPTAIPMTSKELDARGKTLNELGFPNGTRAKLYIEKLFDQATE